MAFIDLSKYKAPLPEMNRGRQVFEGDGDVNAYKALASLGGTLANVATDFHNKELDIFTDREAMNGMSELKTKVAEEQNWALNNIDKDNFVVDRNGVSSQKTYDQYMADFTDQEKEATYGSLSEEISKTKFEAQATPFVTNEKVNAVFKNSAITTERAVTDFNQEVSFNGEKILYSDQDTVAVLDDKIIDMKDHVDLVRKSNGETVALALEAKMNRQFMGSAMDATLRRMQTDPTAMLDFSKLTGLGLMFKNKGEFSKYVTQQYIDIYGETPTDDQLKYFDELLQNKEVDGLGQAAILSEAHPLADTLSLEEKQSYLKQALAITFKNKEKKDLDFSLKMKDLIKQPSTVEFKQGGKEAVEKWIASYQSVVATETPASVTDYQLLQQIGEAATSAVMTDAERDLINTGSRGYTSSPEMYEKRRRDYVTAIMAPIMGPERIDELYAKYPALGASAKASMQDGLQKLQRQTLTKMQTSPDSLVVQERQYYNLSRSAIRFDARGNMIADPKAISAMNTYRRQMLNNMGTVKATMDSKDILPSAQLKSVMDRLQVMDASQQRQFFEQVNAGSPEVATALYTQAIKENKMDLETASLVANAQVGAPDVAKFQTDRLLAIKNRYTGKSEKELMETFRGQGIFGKDVEYKDLNDAVVSASKDSEFLANLKEVARSSGMTEPAINAMFTTKNLQLITMDYIQRNNMEDTDSYFTTFKSKVQGSMDKAIQEFYGTRVVPVNSPALKGMLDPKKVFDAGNTDKMTGTASEVTGKIYDDLSEGRLKMDLTAIQNSPMGAQYKGLSPELQQKYLLRDIKRNGSLSFNAMDTTGNANELVLMMKDPKSGGYYRVKLLDSKGKGVTPVINGVDNFERFSADRIYKDNFEKLQHTKQLAKPNPTPVGKRKTK